MANRELLDYIKQQLKLGVAKDAVRTTLLAAGWAEADVSVAMNEAEGKPAAVQPSQFINRDIFESKSEPLFQMKGEIKREPAIRVQEATPFVKTEPKTFFPQPVKIELPVNRSSRWWRLSAVILIVVSVLFSGIAAFFYTTNTNLTAQIANLSRSNSELGGKISQLDQEIDSLKSQLSTLKAENQDFASQLEIFVTLPPPATTTEPVELTVKGTLGSDKSSYFIVTNREIVLLVKNSKSASVDAALKLLLGNTVEISGTHLRGSRDVTVTAVNGEAISQPTKAATSTSP